MSEPAAPASQPGVSVDPYRAYNFKLLINGVTEGHFTEVSGLGVQIERISYREAGTNTIVRAIPGRVTYPSVTLRYGLTDSTELWQWLSIGRVSRRNPSIVMLDPSGTTEVMRWNLAHAWPEAWYGAALDAMSRELAVESLVLAHEGIERVGPNGSATPAG